MSAPRRKKVVVFAHHREGTSGVADFLLRHLRQSGDPDVVYARFPFLHSTDGAIVVGRRREGKDLPEKRSRIRFYRPALLSYLKDFVYAIAYGLRHARGSDLFVGTTCLLALVGVALRRIGWVKTSVYLMIDYTPRRFPNRLVNGCYYRVDRAAAEGADRVWTLSAAMIEGRFADGQLDRSRVRFEVVPFGNNADRCSPDDLRRYDARRIAYFGGVLASKGAELFAPILRELEGIGLGDVTLTCIGAGDLDFLRGEARRLGVESRLRILGAVADHDSVERELLSCALAIAPYCPADANSFSFYADPGKVKTYLGCALPIVITDVPPIAREVADFGAGAIARYHAGDFARQIAVLLSSESVLREYRARAFSMGTRYSWSRIFSRALKDIL